MRKQTFVKTLIALIFALPGCHSDVPNAQENADMQKALSGKGVKPMSAETRRQMEEAMRQHNVPGAPIPASK